MKLATIEIDLYNGAAIVFDFGIVPISKINQKFNQTWFMDIFRIINSNQLVEINVWYQNLNDDKKDLLKKMAIYKDNIKFRPLYKHPSKIWGIGLNYKDHASDLSEKAPTSEPASFMKADTTIIGNADYVNIPTMSQKTTGEAELGIIIGKKCKNISRENWLDVVAGFTTIIDMTAEDILRKNPRYLTLSKNFDTFFSFGPYLLTPDEIEDVMKLKVATVINGKIHAENVVSNMTFPPDYLVSFHSEVMTLLPGDIISTGTPRAVPLKHGDIIECRIDGFEPLKNPVIDLKEQLTKL